MNLLRLFTVGVLLAPLLSLPATAQVLDPTFSPPTSLYAPGAVYALGPQQGDGKRVMSGFFTRINGTPVGRLVRFDAAGALDLPFLQNVGITTSYVYQVKGLANGQYLLCGSGGTISAGGLVRPELLRLNASGTADASFNAGSGPNTISGFGYGEGYAVQPDGKIVVVGYFDSFDGVAAPAVVRLNADGSRDPSFAVGMGLDVNNTSYYSDAFAVAVQPDGKILVGGTFDTFNGQPAHSLVRLNANGSVDASFSAGLQTGSQVDGLVLQPDGSILVNGYLLPSGATASPGLLRLLPSGAPDPAFSAPAFITGGSVTGFYDATVVLQPDGKILAGGFFTDPAANHVVRLNANGSQDFSFQVTAATGPSDAPNTLGLQTNGSLLVGGSFNSFNGTETPLGRLTATGAADAAFAPTLQTPGSVTAALLQPDGKLVLGGTFTELNGQPLHRLARLTTTGALDAGFSAATGPLPASVTCLALQPDGKVLAGTSRGTFRYAANGSPDPGFAAYLLTSTTALAVQPDGRILMGGSFINATDRYLVRLTSAGAHDLTFVRPVTNTGPGSPSTVDAIMVQPDGRIVVGERFSPASAPAVTRVVRYEATGAFDATFNNLSAFTPVNGVSTTANHVYALALQPDGKILAGGNFGAVDGTLHYGVARLSATGTPDATFVPNALLTGTVYSLARQPNGRVLLGGSFSNSGAAIAQNNLARVLDDGSTDASFANTAAPNSIVRALMVQSNGAIVLAGSFTTVGGQPSLGVARIIAANVLHVAAPAAVAARTAAWPVPAHGQLHVAPDQSAQPLSMELLDALGRPVRNQPATSAAEQSISLATLPTGMYLLRVSYAAGVVTRRIAVE